MADDYGDFGAGITFSVKDLASGVFKQIKESGTQAYDKLKDGNDKLVSSFDKLKSKMSSIKDSLTSLKSIAAAGILGYSVKEMAMQGLDAAAKWQKFTNIISFSSKDSQDAGKNIAFLTMNADKLGIDVEKSGEAYASLMGSFRGTSIQGGALRQVFDGITTAASGMGLTGEQTQGAVLALSQMMGKGVVSSEELRGQLAERVPGAMAIAARSMNVTQAALGDMMKKGQLISADFIPKFTKQLKTEFAEAAEKAANSLQANMNRIKNLFFEASVGIGNFLGPGLRAAMDFIGQLRAHFDTVKPALMNFWGLLKQAGSTVLHVATVLASFVGSLFGFKAGGDAATTVLNLLNDAFSVINPVLDVVLVTVNAITEVLNFLAPAIKYVVYGVGIFTVAMWALNVAMTVNPIGLIIKGLALLAVGVTYAYQRFAPFRAVFGFMKDAILAVYPLLKSFGDIIAALFTGNATGLVTAFTDIKKQIASIDLSSIWKKNLVQAEVDVAANKKESGLDQPEAKDNKKSYSYDDLLKKDKGGKNAIGADATKDKDKKKAAGSGRGGLVVNIQKLIGELKVVMPSASDTSAIKDLVSKALIDAIRDVEASY